MRFLNVARKIFMVSFVFCFAGCGEPPSQAPPETGPLTVEAWKTLPVSEKYDESSFQRLRANDPKLKTDRAWDQFMREVVIPERKQDIPGTPGQPSR